MDRDGSVKKNEPIDNSAAQPAIGTPATIANAPSGEMKTARSLEPLIRVGPDGMVDRSFLARFASHNHLWLRQEGTGSVNADEEASQILPQHQFLVRQIVLNMHHISGALPLFSVFQMRRNYISIYSVYIIPYKGSEKALWWDDEFYEAD